MTELAPDPVAPDPGVAPPPVLDLELRVLAGRAAGARAALAAAEVSVGHALDSDIVVRDAAARGVFLKLRPQGDSAELQVLSGEVEFLGHVLTAPSRAILPAYVPLRLGETSVALGRSESPRWAEAERLLASGAPDAAPPTAAAPPALWRELLGLAKKTPVVPALAAVAIVAGSGAVMLGTQAAATLVDRSPGAHEAGRIFHQAGYRTLKVEQGADGRLVVRGLVARAADRSRLEALIRARNLKATLDVKSGEDLAMGVSEVMRANGVQADVRPAGLGVVSVALKGGDAARVEDARRIALRDVGGLKRVLFTGGAGLGGTILSEDPRAATAKRVLAVVGGEGGYVETADGSKYFPGAVLPSGHTIVAIADRDVTVQRDGQVSHLLF